MMFSGYWLASGEIYREGSAPDGEEWVQAGAGEGIVLGRHDGGTHWVEGGEVVPRPAIEAVLSKTTIFADGIDAATIAGLPDPCVLSVDGEVREVAGGEAGFRSSEPGTYEVAVAAWPYLPWSATITVEAA